VTFSLPIAPLVAFGLVSVRLLAFLLTAPLFSHAAIPMRVRAAFALLLAASLAPGVAPPPELQPAALALAALAEVLVGACLGLGAGLLFAAVGLMAEVASVQGGLAAAAALDPTSGATSVALGALAEIAALLVFLAVDGHHDLLRAFARSLELLPPGSDALPALARAPELGASLFANGLRLSAPYTGALLLSNVLVGVLGRTIPQLNLMSVQLPAQVAIVIGLFALGAAPFCDAVASGSALDIERVLGVLAGGAP
jgi:flagellar biosynthetic protein FliR